MTYTLDELVAGVGLRTVANFADPEFYANPYPAYAWLRRRDPVWWCEGSNSWVVSRYNDVREALLTPAVFSSRPQGSNKYLELGPYENPDSGMLIMEDPPEHQRRRRIFTRSGAYAKRSVETLRPEYRDVCEKIIRNLPSGEIDVVGQVAQPAVVALIQMFFDLPVPTKDEKCWGDVLVGYYAPGVDASTADALHRYLERMVRERREIPGADPVSAAVRANDEQRVLHDAQMAWNFFDAVLAGAASTVAVAAESIHVLAQDRRTQNAKFWNTAAAAKLASEELLRYTNHIHLVTRTAACDTELAGQAIKEGDAIYLVLASANRDEKIWREPETLDLTRQSAHPNFAFGFGPHIATGVNLARLCLSTLLPLVLEARAPFGVSGRPAHVRTRGISAPAEIRIASAT